MASSKANQLQMLQQSLQNVLLQKQQLEAQLMELDSAAAELKTTNKAYKIVGKIMMAASQSDLLKELAERKEMTTLRLSNFSKQEEKLKQTMESLQKEAVEELKNKK